MFVVNWHNWLDHGSALQDTASPYHTMRFVCAWHFCHRVITSLNAHIVANNNYWYNVTQKSPTGCAMFCVITTLSNSRNSADLCLITHTPAATDRTKALTSGFALWYMQLWHDGNSIFCDEPSGGVGGLSKRQWSQHQQKHLEKILRMICDASQNLLITHIKVDSLGVINAFVVSMCDFNSSQ